MDHVVDQAVTLLKHRKISASLHHAQLIEALGEKLDLCEAGIRGVFCGGTTMAPQYVRFIIEEVLGGGIGFYPTYGNTLMGLAASAPLWPEDNFSVTYYAPRASRRPARRESRPNRLPRGLWPVGSRRTDHSDPGALSAPVSRTR